MTLHRATKEGNHYVINGSKSVVLNGPRADFIAVVARTSGEQGIKTEFRYF